MLVTDGNGLPIGLELANASPHEVKLAVPTLETVRVPHRGRGRPKQRPEELVADKAYDSKRFREWLRSKGIKPTIPSCVDAGRRSVRATQSTGKLREPSPGF
jgi:transposase